MHEFEHVLVLRVDLEPHLFALGDEPARWAPIVAPGTVLGPVQRELVPHSVRELPRVIASCSHDTAAAVAAVPAIGVLPKRFDRGA